MKDLFTKNLGLKILSIFFAIGLWIMVVNVDDPVTTKNFKNIPVTFLNENILLEEGKVYEVLEDSNVVTIKVRAKRSILESMDAEDFRATADFSERISENSVPVKVEALKNEDKITDITLQNNTVKIVIEEKIEKEIDVQLIVNGNAADGFTVGSADVSPKKITVTGPQSEVANVSGIRVVLDAANATSDISTTLTGVLLDRNGQEINSDRLVCTTKEFQVNAKLLHTKSVDLDFSVEGTVADGYRYVGMEHSPTTVLIAGEPEDLQPISTVVIPASELDIDNARENVVKEIEVSKYLPENIIVVNENEKIVTVTVQITSLVQQKVTFPVSKIDVLNTPTGLDMNYVEGQDVIEFYVQGLTTELAGVDITEQIKVTVDLKGLTEGTHRLQTKVATDSNLEVSEAPYVEVTLVSREETPAPTEENMGNVSNVSGVEGTQVPAVTE